METQSPYTEPIELWGYADTMSVDRFKRCVKSGLFIDYDGFGYPAKSKFVNPHIEIKPSRVAEIPADATHIVWFNR